MKTLSLSLALTLVACGTTIPKRGVDPRATLPDDLPLLAPCALVHAEVDESLSNGARGFGGDWKLIYSSFLIRHPKGVVLVDAAFGDEAEADVEKGPFYFRWAVGSARVARPLATLLRQAGVAPEEVTHVLITHAHWDHTGGLAQLPHAKVLMPKAEAAWALQETSSVLVDGGMPHHFAPVKDRVVAFDFDGPAYDGFAGSYDVFGDGSIVAVPHAGHSPGSTGWYLNSGDGRRWLFAGDAAWVKEGYETPVMKGRIASTFSDLDKQGTADTLGHLHAVFQARRAWIVTSHDARSWTEVPRCPQLRTINHFD